MRRALGKIQINKREDIDDRVAKSLEKEGFVVVLVTETEINKEYLVLEDWKEETNGIKNPFTWAMEHEKRNYKSIEHVIDNARFFMESTHELAYDHGYSDGQIEVLNKIRAEIMSKDGLEEALEIIDKYREESE